MSLVQQSDVIRWEFEKKGKSLGQDSSGGREACGSSQGKWEVGMGKEGVSSNQGQF